MLANCYDGLGHDLSGLLEAPRRASARAVNSVMTATYREIGRRIVEYEFLLRKGTWPERFAFYHAEARRNGWSVRPLSSRCYEIAGACLTDCAIGV